MSDELPDIDINTIPALGRNCFANAANDLCGCVRRQNSGHEEQVNTMAPIWARPIPLSEEDVRSTRALMALGAASAVGTLLFGYELAAFVVGLLWPLSP
jgi:hypothetical protein